MIASEQQVATVLPKNESPRSREVGTLLGLGILFAPLIFSWFTLRKGHSGLAKLLAFSWLGLSLLIAVASGSNDQSRSLVPPATVQADIGQAPAPKPAEEAKVAATEEKGFSNGTYLVGKDIPSGLYKAYLENRAMGMGYIERASDVDMELNSIIANIMLTGDGYVEIKATDKAVKLQGVRLVPLDLKTLIPNIKKEVDGGIYLVGYDIQPGTYKAVVIDERMNMGYVERARNVSMGMGDIIANDIIQGQGYVKVKKTDFAIKVQGAKLTLQE